jgi:hypothetical protein
MQGVRTIIGQIMVCLLFYASRLLLLDAMTDTLLGLLDIMGAGEVSLLGSGRTCCGKLLAKLFP